MKNYALITGASKGIGLELAKLFAKDGYSLVMVARSNDLLEKLKEDNLLEDTVIVAFSDHPNKIIIRDSR